MKKLYLLIFLLLCWSDTHLMAATGGTWPLSTGPSPSAGALSAMTENGVVKYWNLPFCTNSGAAGIMTDTVYYTNPSIQAFLTGTAGSYMISIDVLNLDSSAYPIILSNGDNANQGHLSYYTNNSKWRWMSHGVNDYSTNTFSISNKCYHLVLFWNGTNKRLWVNGVLEIDSLSNAAWEGTNFYLGRYQSAGSPWMGYVQNLIISDTAATPATLTPSPTPFPVKSVTPYIGNPVLAPSLGFEGSAVSEPSVLNDGTWRMAYTGGWITSTIGIATSTDGLTWTKSGVKIGGGAGGEAANTSRPSMIRVGNVYKIYYTNSSTLDQNVATSTDFVTFTKLTTTVVAHASIPNGASVHNSGFYYDGQVWWELLEVQNIDGIFRTYLFNSIDGGNTFQKVQGPLTSLQVGGGMYGGPKGLVKLGNYFHLWYHAGYQGGNSPTLNWHASSSNLFDWKADSLPALTFTGNTMGLAVCDQLADSSILQVNAQSWLFFDAVDNAASSARIGAAIYNGTLLSMVGLETPTPTPTNYPLFRRLRRSEVPWFPRPNYVMLESEIDKLEAVF